MEKWEVIRVHCSFLANPHDKFCICISPDTNLFMFINSEPPQFRKARDLAVSIENYEATFLSHTSYVDTTKLQSAIPLDLVQEALADTNRKHGLLAPSIRKRIIEAVEAHDVMEPIHKEKLIND